MKKIKILAISAPTTQDQKVRFAFGLVSKAESNYAKPFEGITVPTGQGIALIYVGSKTPQIGKEVEVIASKNPVTGANVYELEAGIATTTNINRANSKRVGRVNNNIGMLTEIVLGDNFAKLAKVLGSELALQTVNAQLNAPKPQANVSNMKLNVLRQQPAVDNVFTP